ncbi:trypsin-like serine peptidase [Nonomuraea sp. H19]|uniref:trypsin-like serine peptidase n=1 Tax=Nonomuraea sp. H19 TaxID=3452206 RepID=UPI003F8B80EF
MKRILLPASGALLATGLLAAGLAGTAQADEVYSADQLASDQKAAEILDFWTKSDNAALKSAKAYYWDNKDVKKIVSKGGYVADGKPGATAPIGEEKKVAAKVTNVNLPKTIGKVFFEGRDGNLYWCSGTSIQAKYRNLVATAGHCVYDIAANDEVVSRWVFVPGYYQGKAPWGIYVGKQAFTHYDFDVYEDFDRDYAFVTVYNGVGGFLNKPTKVTKAEFDKYQGKKDIKRIEITKAEYDKCKLELGECYADGEDKDAEAVGPDYPGAVLTKQEVSKATYDAAGVGKGNGNKIGEPVVEHVTKAQYDAYTGLGTKSDAGGNYTITHYYVQKWVKPAEVKKYYVNEYYIFAHFIKSVGRLGDNVGGQGFAWNQPTGKYVRTFGYPANAHPDGSKPYSGVTPKWCYGKTAAKGTKVPSLKIEEHVSLKCAVTGGYSGAPWLLKYSNAKRLGYVNGVTSMLFDADSNDRWDHMSTPYFDGETNTVYTAAANVWSGDITWGLPK